MCVLHCGRKTFAVGCGVLANPAIENFSQKQHIGKMILLTLCEHTISIDAHDVLEHSALVARVCILPKGNKFAETEYFCKRDAVQS